MRKLSEVRASKWWNQEAIQAVCCPRLSPSPVQCLAEYSGWLDDPLGIDLIFEEYQAPFMAHSYKESGELILWGKK